MRVAKDGRFLWTSNASTAFSYLQQDTGDRQLRGSTNHRCTQFDGIRSDTSLYPFGSPGTQFLFKVSYAGSAMFCGVERRGMRHLRSWSALWKTSSKGVTHPVSEALTSD